DAVFAHTFDQQRLTKAVVDLVRARMKQVFALEIDLCPAEFFRQTPGEEQGRGTSSVVSVKIVQALAEPGIATGLLIRPLEFFERGHEGLGNIAATIRTEPAGDDLRLRVRHGRRSLLFRNACCSHIVTYSYLPGEPLQRKREPFRDLSFRALPRRLRRRRPRTGET